LITIGLQASLQVVPGSVMYDTLLDSGEDTPVYFSVWLWNYTNSEDYTYTPAERVGNGEWSFPVPYVEEVGPFVYKEVFATDQVQFKDSEGNIFSAEEVEMASDKSKYVSIVSHSKTQYVQVYDGTNEKCLSGKCGLNPYEVNVSALNLLSLGLPKILDYICLGLQGDCYGNDVISGGIFSFLASKVDDLMAEGRARPVLDVMTAQEALWEYEDPILNAIKEECEKDTLLPIPSIIKPDWVNCSHSEIGQKILSIPSMFGILRTTNGTIETSGNFWQQATGVEDYHNYLAVEKLGSFSGGVAGLEGELSYWPEFLENGEPGHCNEIKGTDGTSTFPDPIPETNQQIDLFSADLFRTIALNYSHTLKTEFTSMDAYRYDVNPFLYANYSTNPENYCFCAPAFWNNPNVNPGIKCETYGEGGYMVIDGNGGLPIVIGNPHFLWGEPQASLTNGDFQPDFDTHAAYLVFEPMTGSPIIANKRIQQSMLIAKDDRFGIFKNMEKPVGVEFEDDEHFSIMMPFTWVNESFTMTEDLEHDVALGVKTIPAVLLGIGLFFLCFGLCCGGLGIFTKTQCSHILCGPTDPYLLEDEKKKLGGKRESLVEGRKNFALEKGDTIVHKDDFQEVALK